MKPATHWKRWTAREDEKLRLGWGEKSIEDLAVVLGRTSISTYWRGCKLGLTCSVPQGYSYLTTEADRVGFDTSQLRQMMVAAHLPIHRTMARPCVGVVPAFVEAGHRSPKGAKSRWRVPTVAIDEAVRIYRELFSVRAHAHRVRLTRTLLAGRLRAAGVLGEKRPGVEAKFTVDVVDAVMASKPKRVTKTPKRSAPTISHLP